MQLARLVIPACLFVLGCKSTDEPSKEPPTTEVPAASPAPATPPAPPPVPPVAAEPAPPEPTTPEEIELALKAAMVTGKELEVIKYCELAKVEAGKGNPQTALGCTLAACRADQADKARAWSQALPKALKKQAIEICMANKVTL